jgi:amino acid transporter
MKTLKTLDLFIQLLLLALTGFVYIINDPEKFSPLFIVLAYAAVQVISLFVNLGAGPRPWKMKTWRKYHLVGVLIVLAAIVVALIQDSFRTTGDKDDKYSMPGLGTLVYTTIPAILLALFYTVITWFEWKKMRKQL